MESYVNQHPVFGNTLWLEQGDIQIGIALDYGIRVRHLSIKGMENLYYEQPTDLSDGFGTADTWKLRGGHRMWLAPESAESYYPDDAPISYTLKDNGVLIVQDTEPWLNIQKTLEITFLPDNTVQLLHNVYNRSSQPIIGTSWGVNSLDGSGDIEVDFGITGGGYSPRRIISLWGETNLGDPRVKIEKNRILAKHMPEIKDYFKIGVYCPSGKAVLESKGQRLSIGFHTPALEQLPDRGCNFELYLHSRFLEMETLGVLQEIAPDESASHRETWKLEKL